MHGHNDGLWSLNYFADGRQLISSSVDGAAKIWDSNTGQCTNSLVFHEAKVYNAVVSPDMTMAATAGVDRKIAVWDLRRANQPVFVNEDSQSTVSALDFSNDGKAVISATFGGKVNVIDLETREQRVDYDIMFLEPEREEEEMCYHLASVKDHP